MSASSVGEMVIQDVLMASSVRDTLTASSSELCTSSHEPTQTDAFLPLNQSQHVSTFDSPGESQPTPVPTDPPLLLDGLWPGEVGHDTFDDSMTPLSPASGDNLDIGPPGDRYPGKRYLLAREFYGGQLYPAVLVASGSTVKDVKVLAAGTDASLPHVLQHVPEHERIPFAFEYREMALQSFERLESTASSTQREMIICGVHIARLEALGKNIRSCQSYLGRVTQVILEQGCLFHAGLACHLGQPKEAPTHYTTPELSPWCAELALSAPIPQPSRMELEAEVLFVSVFIWNDILCSAVEKKMACPAGMHRKLLTDDGFSSSFQAITGCEAWAMVAVMDITSLEIQKSEQEAQGNLSIRGLVSQADTIEGAVDREMARISNMMSPKSADEPQDKAVVPHDLIQTLIYGHAILIFLNTVVSGALTGVPEIHQSIGRAMQAWDMLPATANPRYLAWAYSTSASLASGSQRDVFRNVVARMSHVDVDTGSLCEFSHGVEECWKETDKHGSNHCVTCDWRDIHKRANLNILFV
ncbi:PRO1A C6 Zink-finger protein, partial [Metarhizium majus ARSEF 297]